MGEDKDLNWFFFEFIDNLLSEIKWNYNYDGVYFLDF